MPLLGFMSNISMSTMAQLQQQQQLRLNKASTWSLFKWIKYKQLCRLPKYRYARVQRHHTTPTHNNQNENITISMGNKLEAIISETHTNREQKASAFVVVVYFWLLLLLLCLLLIKQSCHSTMFVTIRQLKHDIQVCGTQSHTRTYELHKAIKVKRLWHIGNRRKRKKTDMNARQKGAIFFINLTHFGEWHKKNARNHHQCLTYTERNLKKDKLWYL